MGNYFKPDNRELCPKCGRHFKDIDAHMARERSAAQDLPGRGISQGSQPPPPGKRAAAFLRLKESRNKAALEFMADLEAGRIRAGSRGEL